MYLSIDIGGTFVKYGYYHQDGECEYQGKFPTIKTNKDAFYQSLCSLKKENVQGVALSIPGIVDSQNGFVESITLLPFLSKSHVQEELENLMQLPVTLENDAKCATLGEMWKGSLQNVQNALMIVIGSGIGATIILNGNIYHSPHHKAGEIGSILIPTDSNAQTLTNFGKHNNANRLIAGLSDLFNCKTDGQIVFEKLSSQSIIHPYFKQYCREIAIMIYNLDYILDLDVISIGGGISEQDILISTIQEEFQSLRMQYQEDSHQPLIVSSQLQNNAQLLGALYHHLKRLSK